MAQSEAARSTVRTVTNNDEEEEFGPQLITKLQVCTKNLSLLVGHAHIAHNGMLSIVAHFVKLNFHLHNEIGKWNHTG